MFRRWGQRLSLSSAKSGRKRTRISEIDLDNLPPDTYIIYPDRMGNYHAAEMPEVSENAPMEAVFAAEPMLSATNLADHEALRAANLNYFLRQTAETAEGAPQMDEEGGWIQDGAEISEKPSMNLLTGDWSFLRPVLGYVAVGLVGGAMMFAIPALRRPAASPSPEEHNLHGDLRRDLRWEGPEVVIHHYPQRQHEARVVQAKSDVKMYSDMK